MKKNLLVVLFIVVALSMILYAQETFRMAVGAQSGGEIREFFEKIYNEAGYAVEFVELPTLRQISYFNNSEVDGILFLSEDTINSEIESNFTLGFDQAALFAYPLVGYAKTENVEEFNNLPNYEGLKILYIYGNSTHDGRIKNLGAIPASAPNIESAVLMISAGRGDILMTAPRAPDAAIKENNLEGQISMLARPLSMNNYYQVVSLRFKDQEELFRSLMIKYQEDFARLLGQ